MKVSDLERFQVSIYDTKDQLKQHIYTRSTDAFAAGDRARDNIATIEQLEKHLNLMRESFIRSIGGLPPFDTPLHPQTTGTWRGDGYSVENVMFESRHGQWVTGNLYIPDGLDSPSGAVLHLCGHNPMAKQADLYQTVSLHLVRAGLIVLTIDPIGQGERLSYYDRETGKTHVAPSIREHEHVGRQCLPLGDNLVRYFIHDSIRAIDYLCARPEVDPAKIGVTGCSGGGTQTSLMMLCDSRIAAAAPAAFLMNRETYMHAGQAQDAEQIWPGMSKLGLDHEDLLMSMAPRPVLVLAAEYDFFPIEGTRRTVERTKRFWELFGEPDHLQLFEDADVHTYSPPMAKAAAAFFSECLLDKVPDCFWEHIEPIEPERLQCTASGQVRGDRVEVRGVHEENLSRLAELDNDTASRPDHERRDQALAWLRDRVYSERKPGSLNPRRLPLGSLDDEELTVESLLWWSQTGLFNHGFMFRSKDGVDQAAPVTIALWQRGTRSIEAHLDWLRQACRAGRAVLVLDVSGDGAITPNSITAKGGIHEFYGTVHKLTTDLFWLDDSLAALRIFDVVRSIDLVELLGGKTNADIRLYAEGRFSLYAELAEVLDGRLKLVEIENGVDSMAEWVGSRYYDALDSEAVLLPGMLRYFDLPDLRRWRASTPSNRD
ncbi:alpha/beta hydrolase family protein [Paenibacillus hemerocallicola]|nr:acetylxylan esterase [Paenibacillus hemerocallicola]